MEHFAYIPFVPDKKTVMRRMGAFRAQFPKALKMDIDAYLNEAESTFHARGIAVMMPLRRISLEQMQIGEMTVISAKLSKLLAASKSVYLMGASLKGRDVEKISDAMRRGEGLKAFVWDAYASECVDGALSVIMARKNESLRHTGQKLTRHRFSAGYGDLDIKYQKVFFDLLGMDALDVQINEKYMLSPEKSVIALAGVE